MTTRKQIIAQLDSEIVRLEKVRDLLMAAMKDARKGSKAVLPLKLKAQAPEKNPEKKRKQKAPAVARATSKVTPPAAVPKVVASAAEVPAPPVSVEPEIKRLPPRRRMERRHAQSDKHGKSAAALSGAVPQGPVAVSATEARKMQERAATPAPPTPPATELRPEAPGERSLGSLIQAFERRAGLSGLETS
jgi:hypothetical protein